MLLKVGNFGHFPCSWFWIRILNTDPDPGQPNQGGSERILTYLRVSDKRSQESVYLGVPKGSVLDNIYVIVTRIQLLNFNFFW
jgi:hypothetical protein